MFDLGVIESNFHLLTPVTPNCRHSLVVGLFVVSGLAEVCAMSQCYLVPYYFCCSVEMFFAKLSSSDVSIEM